VDSVREKREIASIRIQAADHGRAQAEPVPRGAAAPGADGGAEREPEPDRQSRDQPPEIAHEVAARDDPAGIEGQGLVQAGEQLGDLGQHDGHEDAHHDARKQEHHRGVDDDRADLVPQPDLALEVVGEPLEHGLQRAAGLARAHHADVEVRKHAVARGHRVGERGALVDAIAHLADHALQARVLDLLGERAQRETSGIPAPTSVASWRVASARSSAETREKCGSEIAKRLFASARTALSPPSASSVRKMPSRRSRARAVRGLSASRWPRVFFPRS
jgi:hypothetical protein